jgi:hypothetical protein
MNDIVNLYPTSCCTNYDCKKEYIPDKGFKSNLSINGYNSSQYFDCYNKVELQKKDQLFKNEGISSLNPQFYTQKISQGFKILPCKQASSCSETTFISQDPRQYSAPLAQYLPLDIPPISGKVKLRDIYNSNLDNYKTGYKTYEDMNDGQIEYYIDKSIADPLFQPVYTEPAVQVKNLYQDPMGAIKLECNREPILNTKNPTIFQRENYPTCLSFLQDTQSFREDLISLQQRKNNQEKWTARWEN